MTNEALKEAISAIEPAAAYDESGQWMQVSIEPGAWPHLAQRLKEEGDLAFDYLFCETCVDWKTHMTMVYHLESTAYRHIIVVKINLDRANPTIATVCNIWRTAEFHEREIHELFGVHFEGNPDLRNLILPDDWEGYPLRKDYEDPINMIKL